MKKDPSPDESRGSGGAGDQQKRQRLLGPGRIEGPWGREGEGEGFLGGRGERRLRPSAGAALLPPRVSSASVPCRGPHGVGNSVFKVSCLTFSGIPDK